MIDSPVPLLQVTKFQLEQQRALDEKLKAEEQKQKEMDAKRALTEDHYEKLVTVANSNKQVGGAGRCLCAQECAWHAA